MNDFNEIAADLTRAARALGARPVLRVCAACGGQLDSPRKWFCSTACRLRAMRRRRAGLPENCLPQGGNRGNLPLREVARLTQDERA